MSSVTAFTLLIQVLLFVVCASVVVCAVMLHIPSAVPDTQFALWLKRFALSGLGIAALSPTMLRTELATGKLVAVLTD